MNLLDQDLDALTTVEELEAHRAACAQRMTEIDTAAGGRPPTGDAAAEFEGLRARIEDAGGIDDRIAHIQHRQTVLGRLIRDTDRIETGDGPAAAAPVGRPGRTSTARRPEARRVPADIFDLGAYRAMTRSDGEYEQALHDGARYAIERAEYPHPMADPDAIRADLDRLALSIDNRVAFSRHLIGTGSPAYCRAFALAVAGQALEDSERRLLRAMELTTGSAGGYAVPFQLDPTLIRTSDGAINALRTIARVERITGKEYQLVTAGGITVRRGLEGSPAVPTEPLLGQPSVPTVKVDAFIPFTIELGLAWQSILAALAPVIQDGKDEEEADSFIYGDGVDEEPGGLLGTLPNGSRIGVTDFSSEDLYAITGTHTNRLAPRWLARGRWLGSNGVYNEVRSLAAESDGSDLWNRIGEDRAAGLLGKPVHEQSTMPPTSAGLEDAGDFLVLGDFNQFLIVDRIGMTVEVIQHLTRQETAGAGYGIPTGQRGLYAHWHNNAKIIVPNAFRALHAGSVGSGS